MLELHCHTTYSDGTLTPEALVAAAHQAGVKALAITDHDTTAGWDDAQNAAELYGLTMVPGVEVSTVYNGRSLHILGFYPNQALLAPCLAQQIAGRQRRAQTMVDRLAALGLPIQLPTLGRNMAPGRPHIAQALVEAGHVPTSQAAFERYLGEDKPAYACYEKFFTRDAIARLLECGGVPVWAHPYLFRGGHIDTVLPDLVDAGLMGLEVYHPTHSRRQVTQLLQFCDRYGLLKTGGSDYHGPSRRQRLNRQTGKAKGPTSLNQHQLPLSLLRPIWEAALALQPSQSSNPHLETSPLAPSDL